MIKITTTQTKLNEDAIEKLAIERLKADGRDIMPTTESRDMTFWRLRENSSLWGWISTGWGSEFGEDKIYAIFL